MIDLDVVRSFEQDVEPHGDRVQYRLLKVGRESADDITVFKNGGGGHLDLMCARILHDHCRR